MEDRFRWHSAQDTCGTRWSQRTSSTARSCATWSPASREVKDMDEAIAWVKCCPNPMPGPRLERSKSGRFTAICDETPTPEATTALRHYRPLNPTAAWSLSASSHIASSLAQTALSVRTENRSPAGCWSVTALDGFNPSPPSSPTLR